MTTIDQPRRLLSLAGQEVGVSDWLTISQERIDAFAAATGDQQWIHVDPARAAAESPFGGTIAHGFLTLSVVSALLRDAVVVAGVRLTVNYGLNRVRFVAPVPAGARLRARIVLGSATQVAEAVQATWQITMECEGAERPALVAEWIVRYYPHAAAGPDTGRHM